MINEFLKNPPSYCPDCGGQREWFVKEGERWKATCYSCGSISDATPKFVILEGLEECNWFFTSYEPGRDPTLSASGEKWYLVLGYADSVEEAQVKLYGRAWVERESKRARGSVVT